jgi:DNA-binding IclR family transcriptional regulator
MGETVGKTRRLAVLEVIRKHGGPGATYLDICRALGISKYMARRECAVLSENGLIALSIRQVPEVAGTAWGQRHYWNAK